MFTLRVLGGAVIEGPHGPLSGRVSQRRRVALLAVLALARERPVSRDKLLAIFWPESNTERARHSLADSLYQIRRELGESAIVSAGEDLWLNSEVLTSDAADFETALARGDAARAVALYRGPFLDGFFLSDAPDFERWADAERERLARAYATALEQLAEEATARGDTKAAVECWRRLAAGDLYNARITLRLMEALEAAGDRVGAIQQARVHATLLAQEFEAEPDPDVTAFAERLRTGPAAPHRSRGGDDGEVEVSTPPLPSAAGEDGRAPPTAPAASEPPSIPKRALPARTRHGLAGWRAAGLFGALIFGLAAVFSVASLLPETSTRPGADAEAAAASPRAIAVLPFVNLSRDPAEEYFSDGLTEELIGVVSQVRALRVLSRTSAFAFKGENRDIREIGEALGVGTVLEGSVRRAGDRIRVTAQLINTADGFHLWAETYEREGTDVFAIQSDLALRIAAALEAELTPAEQERIARRPTTSSEAHTLYLKGRHFWNQRTSGGFARAIEHYEAAIAADPRYAAAYAGLATTYSLQGLSGDLAPGEARERMRAAVLKALELDEGLAEAHTALGAYLNVYEWNSEASEQAYLRAIALDPNYGTARHLYGNLLGVLGRVDEAIAQKRKAIELDPLAPQLSNSLGGMLVAAGHTKEGLEHIRNALELDSTFASAHVNLGEYYASAARVEEALHAFRRAVELTTRYRPGLARALALAGGSDEARALLAELQANADRTGVYAPSVASAFLAVDDIEGALAWLERSYRQRHPELRFIRAHAEFERIAGEPRFRELLRRIGLPH